MKYIVITTNVTIIIMYYIDNPLVYDYQEEANFVYNLDGGQPTHGHTQRTADHLIKYSLVAKRCQRRVKKHSLLSSYGVVSRVEIICVLVERIWEQQLGHHIGFWVYV